MPREEAWVLHVAGAQDDEALETLCRTTRVIAALDVEQLLLVVDSGQRADLVWSAALPVEVRPLRLAQLSTLARVAVLRGELARFAGERALYAVHLHGVVPCLLGAAALLRSALPARVLYSPHLAQAAAPWTLALFKQLLQSRAQPHDCVAVTASLTEAPVLSKLLDRSAEVLPELVSETFFDLHRREAGQPRIVADGSVAHAAGAVARLSVLLNGRSLRVRIAWLGAAPGEARSQFDAAGVEVLDVADEPERGRWLSQAWAYLHLAPEGRLARGVPQAMAAGVACLVSDTPAHRALVRHGETGFVCTSERDLLEKLVGLLRDPLERARMGEAARADAQSRFTSIHFERAILRAYGVAASGRKPVRPALRKAINRERQASWNRSGN
jgi:hypothetical protein